MRRIRGFSGHKGPQSLSEHIAHLDILIRYKPESEKTPARKRELEKLVTVLNARRRGVEGRTYGH